MEEKRRDAGTLPAASSSAVSESPAAEPASSRRRAGGQKRKANNLNTSNSSSTPSKRITRDKSLMSHPPIHNGPLTRARQGPNNHASASALGPGGLTNFASSVKHEVPWAAPEGAKLEEQAVAQELNKASEEWEALEAKIEAEFEAIRSRDSNAHVVPSHCGWFSWTRVHPLEERVLPSFFNRKSQTRTSDMYMEIRNWIMKKFHANPNTQIELKDLSELEVGDLDARQEVMEFLDHWGLINFHPFPPIDSTVVNADGDGAAKKDSLLEKLYRFEAIQLSPPVLPKPKVTTPSVPSGLFPESAIAEELARPEGPAVEYHCNSCSADCSRKRYHCQKQADFDLCTDCFNNGKFGSNMSSSDFILMEPAEVPGVSGGKWTDQETLLLLEALELYKENWNEIAEHVATKTKAQCILHFVQMPIEDTFFDFDDDIDAGSKETADPAATNDNSFVHKDVPETNEGTAGANEDQHSPMETSKPQDASEAKVCQETSKPEDASEVKVGQEASKSEDTSEAKVDQRTGENCALTALREAFEAVGYLPTPESPLSFAEVGNPVMALAVFLARLVEPGVATASARSFLKSTSGNSPGMQLAARHCFLLEDPPDEKKELAGSVSLVAVMADRDAQKDETQEDRNLVEDNSTSVLDDKDLTHDQSDKKIEGSVPEEKTSLLSPDGESTGKLIAAKEPGAVVTNEGVEPDDLNESISPELPKNHQPSIVKESEEGTSGGEPPQSIEAAKDVDMLSHSLPSEKNEPSQPVMSKLVGESSQPTEASKDVDMMSDSLPSEKKDPQQPVTSSLVLEPSQPLETPKDIDMVSDSLPPKMNEPHQPVTSNSMVENGATTGEDQIEDSNKAKHDCTETEDDHDIDKIKHAAVSAFSAAVVKAKLLANQEEEQIQQLATSLIEKQLHKLETKLAFFNDMESVITRVREQLDRSRQRLYHERAQIIASRLGLPASSSRPMPPSSFPSNRIATNFTHSVPRPPMSMTAQRPPISRPIGTMPPTSSNQFVSTTAAGSSIRPSSQEKLSSVVTK